MNLAIDYNKLIKKTLVEDIGTINIAENICANNYYVSRQFTLARVNNNIKY